jgi:hypothetical protein
MKIILIIDDEIRKLVVYSKSFLEKGGVMPCADALQTGKIPKENVNFVLLDLRSSKI